jgi:cellulose synthase/poly-beta-1,6-N-acetylglucosamine synthase-like glycosyltransferase
VLDADSRLAPEAGPAIAAQAGLAKAFQCRLLPADYDGSGLATLMALSEIVDQSMHDRLRTRLGWPVRLRGTGMLLPPAALEQVSPELSTEVEDIALTLLLAAAGLPIERLEAAVVRDPKPRKVAAGARQRARWFRGQWIALWRYRAQVLRVAAQGPRGWSLLSSLFLKPRWLAALTAALLALACRAWPWVAGPLWIWVAAQAFALGAGLLFLGQERWLFLKALAYVPGFVLMWLRGMALALRRLPWPRVRAQP